MAQFCIVLIGLVLSGCFSASWIKTPATFSFIEPSCDPLIIDNYGGGNGTAEKPYTLCSLSQWTYFSNQVSDFNAFFKLETDLDFAGVTIADFKSIGSAANPFTGEFDGNGKTIKNISLTGLTVPVALFLQTAGDAKIKNLNVMNYSIQTTLRGSTLILDHSGTETLSLDNITLDSITITLPGYVNQLGALVGYSTGSININQLLATDISMTIVGDDSGGLIGQIVGRLDVTNSRVERLTLIGDFMNTDNAGAFVGIVGNIFTPSPGISITDLTMIDITTDTGWTGAGVLGQAYVNAPIEFRRVHVTGQIEAGGGQSGLIQEVSGGDVLIEDSSFEGVLVNYGNSNYGGLVGLVYGSLTVRRSYFSGTAGAWSGHFGGIVSYVSVSILIEDSYVLGNRATSHATQGTMSGIVGIVSTMSNTNVTIRRSFYAGSFSGTATPARSCILRFQGTGVLTVQDVYFDSTLCTHPSNYAGPVPGSTGVNTATLQTAVPLTNWDPTVWSFANSRYPKLVWQD